MDIYAKQSELFFNNLLILEFEKSAVEKEYRVKCDKDMFSLPNQRMFEVVTHFLFEKLNEVSEEKYNIPWPLIDKEQHRQFQKIAVDYLTSIAQESNIKFPRVVLSVISTFGGQRFYELYLAFSSHVVEKNIRKNDNVPLILRPSVSKYNYQDVVETLKIATMLSAEKLQEVLEFSLKSYEFSLKTSNNFIMHIQNLKSSLATNSSLLNEKNAFLQSSFSESDANDKSLKCAMGNIFERANKVKKCWRQFKSFFEKERKFWDYILPAITENPETFFLDGAELKLDINDSVKEQCPELNKICSIKAQEEKTCLLKYLKIYSIFLKFYEETLLKGDLLQIEELSNVQKTWSFESNINELKTIHEKLASTLLNIKENSQLLQAKLLEEEGSEDLQIFTSECSSWNFSSKHFQDELNSNRLIFTEKVAGVLKTSLFTNDSGLESASLSTFQSPLSSIDSSFQHKTFYHENVSFASGIKPKAHLQIDTSNVFGSFNQTSVQNDILTTLGKEKPISSFDSDLVSQQPRTEPEKNVPLQTPLHASLFFDIDIDHYRTRKIRESWLLEESLDSVTLPETSFLD